MADIECVFESINSTGSIYISNLAAANSRQILQKNKIKAIISIARSGFVNHKKQDIPYYLYIPAQDHEDYQIIQHFDQTYDFIEKVRKQTNVLVHCMAGVSRSVTIVLAYLLKKYKYTVNYIFNMIKRKRRKINPNKGFIQQLKTYSTSLGIKQQSIINQNISLRESSASKFKRQLMAASQQYLSTHNKMRLKFSQNNPLKDISYKLSQNIQSQKPPNIYTPKKIKKIISSNENLQQKPIQDEQLLDLPEDLLMAKNYSLPLQTVKKPSRIQQKLSKPSRIQQKINRIRQKMSRDNSAPKKRDVQISFYRTKQSKSLNKLNKTDNQSINNEQSSIKWIKTTTTFPDSRSLTRDKQQQQPKINNNSIESTLNPIEPKYNNIFEGFQLQLRSTDKYKFSKRTSKVYF